MNKMQLADRVKNLPSYLFAQIDSIKSKLREEGVDVIDLSIGDPDLPTRKPIVDKLIESAQKNSNHRYPSYIGSIAFRRAISMFYEDRFDVSLDPTSEIMVLVGSKEGIAHLPWALINPGDVGLVPNIGYPVYGIATLLAGGEIYHLPLDPEFLPCFSQIPKEVLAKAKIMFLNYPNNPTSAVASLGAFEEAIAMARAHDIVICHDAAYSEVCFDGYQAPSFLQVAGAKDVGVEFHSLSKTFNMTGWRIGFVVGHADVIEAMSRVKTNVDSGVFNAIQEAGIFALEHYRQLTESSRAVFQHRRDLVARGLDKLGISYHPVIATYYFWCKVPTAETSSNYCSRILRECGVCLTPGNGFGGAGEGFFRLSITAPETQLETALTRLSVAGA